MAMTTLFMTSCQLKETDLPASIGDGFTLIGHSDVQTKTAFGTPDASTIPFLWSEGDKVMVNGVESEPLSSSSATAHFIFNSGTVNAGDGVYYGVTKDGSKIYATVSSEQSGLSDELGENGDFGYAEVKDDMTFTLSHKSSYLWLNPYTTDLSSGVKVKRVDIEAANNIVGKSEITSGGELGSVTDGSKKISLNFDNPRSIPSASSDTDIWAVAVVLPGNTGAVTIDYILDDGGVTKKVTFEISSKELQPGNTYRITNHIQSADIVEYELRVLTFEDADAKFEPYYLDYADNAEIRTWSDLIDDPQYMGPMTYGDCMSAAYNWWDEGNTDLCHIFPDNNAYCFWGGGHAISNYWGEGFDDEDRNRHIAKYYGQDYVDQWEDQPGADSFLGWFNVQMMVPVAPHSGNNFVVHYGYKDDDNYIENLPEIVFYDGEPRVIDHMYVTNTNYTLNQLVNGVKSEEGNTFGGSWEGLNEDAWLKIVAYGFEDPDADAYADPDAQVEFWLVKGEDVVTDWEKWDLSGLGEVAKVRFNFLYSEDMGGSYGFTIPGYFAYDDVAVRFPIE